jgi:hypothetical protein
MLSKLTKGSSPHRLRWCVWIACLLLGACFSGGEVVEEDNEDAGLVGEDTTQSCPDAPGCEDADDEEEDAAEECQPPPEDPQARLGDACTVGEGACESTGQWTCAGGQTLECDATPGQPEEEVCDGVDNDCNGSVDDDPVDEQEWYADADGDGYGDSEEMVMACDQPDGYVDNADDCDDDDEAINPDADEVCDGIDNNCDGHIDRGEVAAVQCANQEGVCAGATVATCVDDAYATCGGDQYGDDFIDAADEGWSCDGLDNNCDGEVDEACCGAAGNRAAPTDVTVGMGPEASEGLFVPKIVPAAAGAPAGAEFLVAWPKGEDIELQHVDRAGTLIGAARSLLATASTQELTGVDVVSSASGYDVVWTVYRYNSSQSSYTNKLHIQGLDANLDDDGSGQTYVSTYVEPGVTSEPTDVWHPRIAAAGDERFIVWSESFTGIRNEVRGIQYNVNDRANPGNLLDLTNSRGGSSNDTALLPDIAGTDDAFVIAWANADDETIYGLSYSNTGTPTPTFEIPVGEETGGQPIATGWTDDDEVAVVYPRFDQSNVELALSSVTLSSADVGAEVELTDDAQANFLPSLQVVEFDDGGDRLVIAWEREGAALEMVVGSTPVDTPGLIDPVLSVRSGGSSARFPQLARGAAGLGAIWRTEPQSGTHDIQFAAISREGVPICEPDP